MNHLLSLWMVFAMLVPQNQNLPDVFYQIPEEIRDTATIILSGTFDQHRTPCIMRSDGLRVWAIDSYFIVNRIHRGKLRAKFVNIRKEMLPTAEYVRNEL